MSVALAAVAGCEVLKEESGVSGVPDTGRKKVPSQKRKRGVSLASFLLRWGNNFFKVFSK